MSCSSTSEAFVPWPFTRCGASLSRSSLTAQIKNKSYEKMDSGPGHRYICACGGRWFTRNRSSQCQLTYHMLFENLLRQCKSWLWQLQSSQPWGKPCRRLFRFKSIRAAVPKKGINGVSAAYGQLRSLAKIRREKRGSGRRGPEEEKTLCNCLRMIN